MSIRQAVYIPTPILSSDVIFWAQQTGSLVQRVDIDGSSNPASWASGGSTWGCSIDEETEQVYFTIFTNDAINRSDYDGSNIVSWLSTGGNPSGCDVDRSYVYAATSQLGRLYRHDKFDGSGPTLLLSQSDIRDVKVDLVNGHLYYCSRGSKVLKRSDLDGSSVTTITTSAQFILAVHSDPDAEIVYYADSTSLRKVDYDGSNDILIYTTSGGTPDNVNNQGMCAELEGGHLYWTDVIDGNMGRVNLDGSNPDKTYGPTITNPNGIDTRYPKGSFYAKPNR